MVDPTDPTTPLDTDFVKGAAAELRALKGYIQNTVPPPLLGFNIRGIKLNFSSTGVVTVESTIFPHITVAKISTGIYIVTITQVQYPLDTNSVGKVYVINSTPNGTITIGNVASYNDSTHTLTIELVCVNNSNQPVNLSTSYVDILVNGAVTDL